MLGELAEAELAMAAALKDQAGTQVTPIRLTELLETDSPNVAARMTAALMPMKKLDLATIEAEAKG